MPSQNSKFDSPSIKSEEVADIIENMPAYFGFIITGIVVLLVSLIAVFGWLVKYPDVVKGEVTITGSQSPVKIVAFASGKIQLLIKKPGEEVKANQYIGVIKNPANYIDILFLDSLLKSININHLDSENRVDFSKDLSLGELNSRYYSFLSAFFQYKDYLKERPFENQQKLIKGLLLSKQKLLKENAEETNRLKKKFETTQGLLKRDSLLYEKRLIPISDLEKAVIAAISSEQEYRSINREVNNNEFSLNDANSKLEQIAIQKADKERQLEVALLNTYNDIQEGIKEWEKKYVLLSPIDGILDFLNFIKDDEFVQSGQELYSVLPPKKETVGHILLPDIGSGKVKLNQEVIIKLNNFPYTQYGSIKGRVIRISLASNQQMTANSKTPGLSLYLIDVSLPNGLTTNYGTILDFKFDAKGVAEIITDDRRLIERLFDNLKYKIS